jgi:hypothetical protein
MRHILLITPLMEQHMLKKANILDFVYPKRGIKGLNTGLKDFFQAFSKGGCV